MMEMRHIIGEMRSESEGDMQGLFRRHSRREATRGGYLVRRLTAMTLLGGMLLANQTLRKYCRRSSKFKPGQWRGLRKWVAGTLLSVRRWAYEQ